MAQKDYTLVLGDKNYSSWSLRAWLLMRAFQIPFREINVDLYSPGAKARILEHSPSGKVPALKADGLTIWDTFAIVEYLAEAHARLAIWPENDQARALARSVSAEMHSGFEELRSEMPMDLLHSKPVARPSLPVSRHIRRIVDIWRLCRSAHGGGGPFLFGAFCAADAYYAPVASRFRTYGVDLAAHGDDGTAAAYVETIFAMPEMAEWGAAARGQLAERGIAY